MTQKRKLFRQKAFYVRQIIDGNKDILKTKEKKEFLCFEYKKKIYIKVLA